MRGKLAAAAVVAVALVAALYLGGYLGGLGHVAGHKLCIPHIVHDQGVASVDVEPLSGSRACPARYRISVKVKPGYRLEGVEVGGKAYEVSENASSITVTLGENATVRVYTRRLVYSVEITGNVSGVYVEVNGSRVEVPGRVEAPYGAVLNLTPLPGGCLEPVNRSLALRVTGSREVRLAWRVKRFTVSLGGNYSGYVLVNGTRRRVPLNLTVACGAVLNVTPVGGRQGAWRVLPLNKSILITARDNVSLRLAWRLHCDGVLIASNVGGVSARVDGVLRRLPYCARAPVVVEGLFYGGGINSTHGWWLGWYWVREGNRTWWWSYGINGSRLRVVRPARVTLYYLPGLKDLPYVVRLPLWPGAYFNGSCPLNPGRPAERIEVRGGWVHVYDPIPCAFRDVCNMMWVTFMLPKRVRAAAVEIKVPKWNEYFSPDDEVDIIYGVEGRAAITPEMKLFCWGMRGVGDIYVLWDGLLNPGEGVGANGVFYEYNGTRSLRIVRPKGCDVEMMPGIGFNLYGLAGTDMKARMTGIPYPKGGRPLLVRVMVKGGREAYFRVVGVAP